MDIEKLKRNHEICIDILDAIQYYENMIINISEINNGFAGTFPQIKRKNIHRIEIYDMCIIRLKQRYNILMLSF